ncbi:nuclear transport factor 2 family protein [Actinomadura sp. GTD37]|uniref:nuclear transport factor 2 family protein n=1 Tax=Actinomadura sp. GTD37 TaxID=1778030 RepID=UPI0035BFF799
MPRTGTNTGTDTGTGGLNGGIARLTDRAEIIDLIAHYNRSLDERRFDDAWARSVFAEDAVVAFPVGGHAGLPGLADFTARFMGRWERTHHHATDHLVRLDGDRAAVGWNMLATHVHPPRAARGEAGAAGPDLFQLGAVLDGTAVRAPGGWRFERLALRVVWTSGRPAQGVPASPTDTTTDSQPQED